MYCFLIGHQISDLPPDWSTLPGVTAVVSALPGPHSQSEQSGRSGHTCREGQQSLLQTHRAAVVQHCSAGAGQGQHGAAAGRPAVSQALPAGTGREVCMMFKMENKGQDFELLSQSGPGKSVSCPPQY